MSVTEVADQTDGEGGSLSNVAPKSGSVGMTLQRFDVAASCCFQHFAQAPTVLSCFD
jgi:hypothetical protein